MPAKASASQNLRRSPRAAPRKRGITQSLPVPAPEPKRKCGGKKSQDGHDEPKRKCVGKKSQDGRDVDKYCWICHKFDENSQDKICFTCPRVYHTACLDKASHTFSDKNVCPECQMDSIDGTKLSKTLTCKRLKELLLATTEQKILEKEYLKNKILFSWPGGDELVKVIDFQILIDKINDIVPYTKTSEFFSDLKWIQHNCFILYGPTSKVSDAAVKLVKAFKTDLLDLEACPDCYYHMLCSTSSDFFVRICDPPHDIIWAQVSGYPYWPAKCLKIVGGIAHVRFFGMHEMGNIPISQCYFISKEHPNYPQKSVPKTPKYKAALVELGQYIALYEGTFGVDTFHYYKEKTAFKPENAVPKPVTNVPEETVPVSKFSKPNITTLPLCIDLIAPEETPAYRDENDELNNDLNSDTPVISSSNAVTVSMTFTEEQSKTLGNDFVSSVPFDSTSVDPTYDTLPSIDIQSCTATTVVTSTPIVASADSLINLSSADSLINLSSDDPLINLSPDDPLINLSSDVPLVNLSSDDPVINLSSDDLNLGAEFSNANLVHESHDETMTKKVNNESLSSEMLQEAVSNASDHILNLQTFMPPEFPTPQELITKLNEMFDQCSPNSRCSTCCKILYPVDDDLIMVDASGAPIPTPLVSEALILSYMSSQGKLTYSTKDIKSAIYTIFIHLWALVNNAPSAPELLTSVILDVRKYKKLLNRTEEEKLKRCVISHQSVIDNLCKEIKNLKQSLAEEKQKNEKLKMEFNDATKNAKLVVDSVKRSSDNFWSTKFKEFQTICNTKLLHSESVILKNNADLERLKADLDALKEQTQAIKNEHEKTLNELAKFTNCHKSCQGTQTELEFSDVFLKTDLDSILEENTRIVKHKVEHELNEQIIQAKRNAFCNACLKPASIHCCMNANYCTKSCQRKHSKGHAKICLRQNETRSRLEPEVPVPQHPQFGHPMINPMNQSQTFARKTSILRLQFEQSSDVITASKDPNLFVYPPASTSAFNAMYAAALEANNPMNMPLNLMTTAPHPDRFAIKPALLPTPLPVQSTSGHIRSSSKSRRHT